MMMIRRGIFHGRILSSASRPRPVSVHGLATVACPEATSSSSSMEESSASSLSNESYSEKKNSRLSASEAAAQMPGSAVSGPVIGKRFYKSAYAKAADDGNGYVVMLDHRILKTPSKKPLLVPSLALAHAIAAEWEYQDQDGIRPFTMPLMKLTSTVLDRVPIEREKIIENLLKFFHTDTLCCREEEECPLHDLQEELWDPLLDWIEQKFGYRPRASSNIFVGDQPKKVMESLEQALKTADNWQLAAIDALSAAAKSLIVAMAVFHGRISVNEALKAIRIEEDCQIEEWGLVEGGHDIDIADLKIRVSSASVFLRLLSS